MLGVHEGHLAALLLGLGQHVQRQRGLAGGLRPVDLHHAAAGQSADAQCQIQRQRAGGDHLYIGHLSVAVAHDGALAVHLLDLLHGRGQRLFLIRRHGSRGRDLFLYCHFIVLLRFLAPILAEVLSKIQDSQKIRSHSVPNTTRGMPAVSGITWMSPKPAARMMRSTSSAWPMPTSK